MAKKPDPPPDPLNDLLDKINCRAVLRQLIELWCAVLRNRKAARQAKAAQKHHAAEWTPARLTASQECEREARRRAARALKEFHQLLTDSVTSRETLYVLVEPAEAS